MAQQDQDSSIIEPAKRIIIICDGTTNDAVPLEARKLTWTNPQRLAACLKTYDPEAKMAQYIHYLSGVATGTVDSANLEEGATGSGTPEQILRGYYAVCLNWRSKKDEIILIGFSRGGYTAKAIARLICDVGILKLDEGLETLPSIWDHWKDSYKGCTGSMSFIPNLLRPHPPGRWHFTPNVSIRACIVWDTVKTLSSNAAKQLAFLPDEEVKTCRGIDFSFHALAMNERRSKFGPMVWTPKPGSVLKQCWFLGHHSDVGGATCLGAANISLAWMLANVIEQKILAVDAKRVHRILVEKVLSHSKLHLEDPQNTNPIWRIPGKIHRSAGTSNIYDDTPEMSETIHWSVRVLTKQGAISEKEDFLIRNGYKPFLRLSAYPIPQDVSIQTTTTSYNGIPFPPPDSQFKLSSQTHIAPGSFRWIVPRFLAGQAKVIEEEPPLPQELDLLRDALQEGATCDNIRFVT